MDNTIIVSGLKKRTGSILLDFFAVLAVYLIPTLSHIYSIPFYLFEPIRLLVVLAMLHTRKQNAYFLALTLPVFSFILAGHPVLFKMLTMSIELCAGVWLYYYFLRDFKIPAIAMIISITLSKVLFYLLQFGFIELKMLTWEEVEHPILPQVIVVLALGLYVLLLDKFRQRNV